MVEITKIKSATDDEVIYDAEHKRVTHIKSGLSVMHVRDEPPKERTTHFKLITANEQVHFEAWHDRGEKKIEDMFPDMHFLEQGKLIRALHENNYHAINIRAEFDQGVFVQVWQKLVQGNHNIYKMSANYSEWQTMT